MKPIRFAFAMVTFLVQLSMILPAQAANDWYVTHGGCRVYPNQRDLDKTKEGIQSYEIWLHLAGSPQKYDPRQRRADVYLSEAEGPEVCKGFFNHYISETPIKGDLVRHPIYKNTGIIENYSFDPITNVVGGTISNFSYFNVNRGMYVSRIEYFPHNEDQDPDIPGNQNLEFKLYLRYDENIESTAPKEVRIFIEESQLDPVLIALGQAILKRQPVEIELKTSDASIVGAYFLGNISGDQTSVINFLFKTISELKNGK